MLASIEIEPTLILQASGASELTVFVDGPDGQHDRYLFRPRKALTLGRSRDCDIVIDDPYVSRKHAELGTRFGECWVRSLGMNASKINNTGCRQNDVYPLDRVDVLRIGRFRIRVFAHPISDDAEAERDTVVVLFSEHWRPKIRGRSKRKPSALTRPYSAPLAVVTP